PLVLHRVFELSPCCCDRAPETRPVPEDAVRLRFARRHQSMDTAWRLLPSQLARSLDKTEGAVRMCLTRPTEGHYLIGDVQTQMHGELIVARFTSQCERFPVTAPCQLVHIRVESAPACDGREFTDCAHVRLTCPLRE